jgi:epoxyqueuosine reductase
MSDQSVVARRERRGYTPKPQIASLLKVSGNPINGLGETEIRRPSPHFWHPPELHPWGELQIVARRNSRKCPGATEAFAAAYERRELIPVASQRKEASAGELSTEAMKFALAHEADDVGIASMDPLYVFEGYRIDEPWVIVLALAHNYERLKHVPSDEIDGAGVCDVGDQHARGARSSYALANWIRAQGYNAHPYPGPSADALLLIPPAIACGLGELGKSSSMWMRAAGACMAWSSKPWRCCGVKLPDSGEPGAPGSSARSRQRAGTPRSVEVGRRYGSCWRRGPGPPGLAPRAP